MKSFLLLGMTLLMANIAFAQGDKVGGGGDATEAKVNEIRSEILRWINRGGASELKYPLRLTQAKYEEAMRKILKAQEVVITFVEEDDLKDEELQVKVNGLPKTCRGFISRVDARPHILCNISRFKKTAQDDLYRLIHHEYAGLAGVEKNNGAASDYEISNQLTYHLKEEKVFKIAINKQNKTPCGLSGLIVDRMRDCARLDGSVKGEFGLVARTESLKEVWMHKRGEVLFSDRLSSYMNYEESLTACHSEIPEVANIKSVRWQLARSFDLSNTYLNARENLPNMNYWFWLSDRPYSKRRSPHKGYLYNGTENYNAWGGMYNRESVRCVAYLKDFCYENTCPDLLENFHNETYYKAKSWELYEWQSFIIEFAMNLKDSFE